MSRKEELNQILTIARKELNEIVANERAAEHEKLVGKYFKTVYGDSISYKNIIAHGDGLLVIFEFYKNSFGIWEIGVDHKGGSDSHWEEIEKAEFQEALLSVLKEIKIWGLLYGLNP